MLLTISAVVVSQLINLVAHFNFKRHKDAALLPCLHFWIFSSVIHKHCRKTYKLTINWKVKGDRCLKCFIFHHSWIVCENQNFGKYSQIFKWCDLLIYCDGNKHQHLVKIDYSLSVYTMAPELCLSGNLRPFQIDQLSQKFPI